VHSGNPNLSRPEKNDNRPTSRHQQEAAEDIKPLKKKKKKHSNEHKS
jgi:hypothetical protein